MRNIKLVRYSMILGAAAGVLLAWGCSRGTGDTAAPDFSEAFVPTDDAAGSIELTVINQDLNVSDSSAFRVSVRDANGAAVPNIQISCDTEQGLIIIEPTTGKEMTDSYGNMSGVVGCAAPGSYQMGCRLPIGGNKRQFHIIHCLGAAPVGWTPWPGTGGGLGGGVSGGSAVNPSTGNLGVRVTGVAFADTGTTSSYSIDIAQNTCSGSTTTSPTHCETFGDTQVKFTVVNNTDYTVRFSRFNYIVYKGMGGNDYQSKSLGFVGDIEVPSGGASDTITGLFAEAASGSGSCSSKKRFNGASTDITSEGFKNIKFELFGEDIQGNEVDITVDTAASFSDFDRCS
jgi:hypothetical protein